ncbi:hypothetical protein E2562_006778 [Oryza meyeriana var. granulata]|uniref:Uncharacterized protein n=1 Tax=Oryza meyeriana var. granulata TaxID=110450 RepID=A0A6G1C4I8_9ORYZ|nr:hypothetical protein E2562_006778 [Oryza meyeriana var. granulata]
MTMVVQSHLKAGPAMSRDNSTKDTEKGRMARAQPPPSPPPPSLVYISSPPDGDKHSLGSPPLPPSPRPYLDTSPDAGGYVAVHFASSP